jgi:hypothetical protein
MTDADNNGSNANTVDRRKFVAGVGALGIAGAAGCLSDGSGGDETPTDTPGDTGTDGTDTPGDTGTDTFEDTPTRTGETDTPDEGTETPTGPAFEPVPTGLVYQFFEGEFSEMPEFDGMEPTSAGDPDIITSEFEDGPGAFRFEGTIPIGDRLQSGTYTFHADEEMASSGQLAMYVRGNEISFSSGRTNLLLNETSDIAVEFYRTGSGMAHTVGWYTVNDVPN